jgi:hypothetical protein
VGRTPSSGETFDRRKEASQNGIHVLRSIEERMEFLEGPGEIVGRAPRTPGGGAA